MIRIELLLANGNPVCTLNTGNDLVSFLVLHQAHVQSNLESRVNFSLQISAHRLGKSGHTLEQEREQKPLRSAASWFAHRLTLRELCLDTKFHLLRNTAA